jgi:hypothetical protein
MEPRPGTQSACPLPPVKKKSLGQFGCPASFMNSNGAARLVHSSLGGPFGALLLHKRLHPAYQIMKSDLISEHNPGHEGGWLSRRGSSSGSPNYGAGPPGIARVEKRISVVPGNPHNFALRRTSQRTSPCAGSGIFESPTPASNIEYAGFGI